MHTNVCLIIIFSARPPALVCPAGFVLYGESCYYIPNDKVTYSEATDACTAKNAHLAEPYTKKKNEDLKTFIRGRHLTVCIFVICYTIHHT